MISRRAVLGLLLWSNVGLVADDKVVTVPDFLDKWASSQAKFQNEFSKEGASRSRASRFFNAAVSSLDLKGPFKELNLVPGLENVLLSVINENQVKDASKKKEVTFSDLQNILKEKPDTITEEQQKQIAALIMVHAEKQGSGNSNDKVALKALVIDYLKVHAQLTPTKFVSLNEDWIKHLGIKPEEAAEMTADKLLKLVEGKGVPSEKEGLAMVSSLWEKSLSDPERLGVALQPISRQLFNTLFSKTDPSIQIQLSDDKDLKSRAMAQQFTQSKLDKAKEELAQNTHRINGGNDTPRGQSNRPSRGFNTSPNSEIPSGPEAAQIPLALDDNDPALKSCIELARRTDLNVPIQIPGGSCASTAITDNPTIEEKRLQNSAVNTPQGKEIITFTTALHCVENLNNLAGQEIQITIKGRSVKATVVADINPDLKPGQSARESVKGGQADLAILKLKIEATEASRLSFARVPNQDDILALKLNDQIPLAIYQNKDINVGEGLNHGVLAATGSMKYQVNFLRYNAQSGLNTDGRADKKVVSPGDSGGPSTTCRFNGDGQATDLLYLGAVSHVDVLQEDTGLVGFISSNQSLVNLSDRVHGPSGFVSNRGRSPSITGRVPHI